MSPATPAYDFHVFVSHNAAQKQYARLFVDALRKQQLAVFLDEDNLLPGDDIVQVLQAGLVKSRHVVLVLSKQAIESRWVALEWTSSLYRDPNAAQRRIIPVLRDECEVPLLLSRLKFVDARNDDIDAHVADLMRAIDFSAAPAGAQPRSEATQSRTSPPRIELPAPGGALRPRSPLYIERPSDREVSDCLSISGQVVVLWGPRQVGKTSMIFRCLHQMGDSGLNVVPIDCSALGARSLAEFVAVIVSRLRATAKLREVKVDPNDTRAALDEFSTTLAAMPQGSVLALDEFDFIRSLPDAGEFLYFLRGLYDSQNFRAAGSLPTSLLIGSFLSPLDLVLDATGCSPFNIGVQLRVRAFSEAEILAFFTAAGVGVDEDDVREVDRFVGGQPYLTHQIAYVAKRENRAPRVIIREYPKYIDRFAIHLRSLESHIRSDEITRNAFERFRDGMPGHRLTYGDVGRLMELGIVVHDDAGTLQYSCELYRKFFGASSTAAGGA